MSTSATGPSGAKDAAEQRESRKTSRNAEGGVVTGLIAGTCSTCRKRKVKCGKQLPICSNCMKLGLECDRSAKSKQFKFISVGPKSNATSASRKSLTASSAQQSGAVKRRKQYAQEVDLIVTKQHKHDDNISQSGSFIHHQQYAISMPDRFSRRFPYAVRFYPPDDASGIFSPPSTAGSMASATFSERGPLRFQRSSMDQTLSPKDITHKRSFYGHSRSISTPIEQPRSMYQKAIQRGRDIRYYNHYRSVVVYNMQVRAKTGETTRPVTHDPVELDDPYEKAAILYPPLYHAILALAAVSFCHRENMPNTDALEHYGLALEHLRIEAIDKSPSLQLLFTHYFLLLCDIASCNQDGLDAELVHHRQTFGLLAWALEKFRAEPDAFDSTQCRLCIEVALTCITSQVLHYDMFNVMTRRVKEITIVDAFVVGFLHAAEQSAVVMIEAAFVKIEHASASIGTLHPVMQSSAVRCAWIHRICRDLAQATNEWNECQDAEIVRQAQIEIMDLSRKLNDFFRQYPLLPKDIYDESYVALPLEIRSSWDSTQYTIRWIQIYVRTSLWPGQRASLTNEEESFVQATADEILYLAKPRWGIRTQLPGSNLISLCICGTVLLQKAKQRDLLFMLEDLDRLSSGWNYFNVRGALEYLYKAQDEAVHRGEDPKTLNWWEVMRAGNWLSVSWYGL